MGAGRKLRVHTLKHEHEAERKWEVALNFKAHSQRHSFSSKAMPPKTPQTVPSVGDKYSNSWGGAFSLRTPQNPVNSLTGHTQISLARRPITLKIWVTLCMADHTSTTTQTTLKTCRPDQAPQITPSTHGCPQTHRLDSS